MNGPEHYREAESALASAATSELGSPEERYHLTAAQVHATLALAAATADSAIASHERSESYVLLEAWHEVTR